MKSQELATLAFERLNQQQHIGNNLGSVQESRLLEDSNAAALTVLSGFRRLSEAKKRVLHDEHGGFYSNSMIGSGGYQIHIAGIESVHFWLPAPELDMLMPEDLDPVKSIRIARYQFPGYQLTSKSRPSPWAVKTTLGSVPKGEPIGDMRWGMSREEWKLNGTQFVEFAPYFRHVAEQLVGVEAVTEAIATNLAPKSVPDIVLGMQVALDSATELLDTLNMARATRSA